MPILPTPIARKCESGPRFNTVAYWQAYERGEISDAQQLHDATIARRERSDRARHAMIRLAPKASRHQRRAPRSSRQYAEAMSTRAARDDRLTPNAKALLQLLVARTGKGEVTTATKAALGYHLTRSARTIQRYLGDLRRYGYIETEHRKDGRGFDTGLVIRVTELARPFYKCAAQLADWLFETGRDAIEAVKAEVLRGETSLSPYNDPIEDSPLGRALERLERSVMESPAPRALTG